MPKSWVEINKSSARLGKIPRSDLIYTLLLHKHFSSFRADLKRATPFENPKMRDKSQHLAILTGIPSFPPPDGRQTDGLVQSDRASHERSRSGYHCKKHCQIYRPLEYATQSSIYWISASELDDIMAARMVSLVGSCSRRDEKEEEI